MTFIKKIILIFFVCTIFASCNKNKLPEGILDKNEMIEILSEMHTIDAYFSVVTEYRYDTLQNEANEAYRQLFDKHGITDEDFRRSIDYYSKHQNEFRDIYENVVLKLNKK